MTHAETAADLLEAVGVEWKQCADLSRDSRPAYEIGGDNTAYFATTGGITYTGPALGTPELDALLLVAGVKWLHNRVVQTSKWDVDNLMFEAFDNNVQWESFVLFHCAPGHTLARAIKEINS